MVDVTVVGLGGMGSALAQCLIESGRKVTVWNRSPAKAKPLVQSGAILASDVGTAIQASPTVITCLSSHGDTISVFGEHAATLNNRDFIELTTGNAPDALTLEKLISGNGGSLLVGAICTYPSGIGSSETCIQIAGNNKAWGSNEPIVRTLGPASTYIGEKVESIAAMFAGHFIARQGFMFGLIYGALIAEKAGVDPKVFFDQTEITLNQVRDYREIAKETICSGDFSNRGAPLSVYAAAFEDTISTIEALKLPAELPCWMREKVLAGIEAGMSDEELPSLIKLLGDHQG